MYHVYILRSLNNNRHYIGQTNDLDKRLMRHNQGRVQSTKYFIPWKIIYTEQYRSRAEAMKREREIKDYKSGIKFHELISSEQSGEVA